MEASVATPAGPATPAAAEPKAPAAPAASAPEAHKPEATVETEAATPGTVHLTDGKAVEIKSIEDFLKQMAGDAGELWVKAEQASGKVINFLKSAVVAHE
jgi:hypothetical protein